MLEVTSLYKSYKNHKVLENISFTAGPGECVGIVGSNGCGKLPFYRFWREPPGQIREASGFTAERQWDTRECLMRRLPMCPRRIL